MFDTLTSQATLLHSDTALGLTCIGNDAIFLYFSAENGDSYRYDMSCRSLGIAYSVPLFLRDTLRYLDGCVLSIDSNAICKTDTSGRQRLWKTTLSPHENFLVQVNDAIFHDGSIYAVGFETACGAQGPSCGSRAVAAKLDVNGKILWQKTYGNNGGRLQDKFEKPAFDPSGDLLCIGTTGSLAGQRYLYLSIIDKDGIQKTKKILSDTPGKQSTSDLVLKKIEHSETGIIHVTLTGTTRGNSRSYYAQIAY